MVSMCVARLLVLLLMMTFFVGVAVCGVTGANVVVVRVFRCC